MLDSLVAIARWPRIAALVGASCIAFAAIFYELSEVDSFTATFYRCLYGAPLLLLIARAEQRRYGPMPRSTVAIAAIAGVFFAADLITYHWSIDAIGAGLASVLVNLQVVLVAVGAWVFLRERPAALVIVAIPIVLVGVVFISGVTDRSAFGPAPVAGGALGVLAALFLAGYLLLIRRSGRDLNMIAGPVAVSTLTAALVAAGGGFVAGDLDVGPAWPAHLWLALLGVTSQSGGYLLLSVSLPRLPASLTSLVLVTQGVTTVGLAVILLGQLPSVVQLLGVAFVVLGLAIAVLPSDDIRRRASAVRGRGT